MRLPSGDHHVRPHGSAADPECGQHSLGGASGHVGDASSCTCRSIGDRARRAYGFRSARFADGPALELGGEFIFPEGFLGDAYVQLPRRWTGAVDFGVGAASVLMVPRGPMGYAQAGVKVSDGLYVFTTQSVGRFTRSTQAELPNPPVIWWQPSIAVQPIRSDDRIGYFFITGTIGHARGRCGGFGTCDPPPGAVIAFGFAASRPIGFPHGRQ